VWLPEDEEAVNVTLLLFAYSFLEQSDLICPTKISGFGTLQWGQILATYAFGSYLVSLLQLLMGLYISVIIK
jgi:hypothetical protein